MKTIENIFENSIKQRDESVDLKDLIKELSFGLSHKKLGRLKDTAIIQKRIEKLYEIFTKCLKDEDLYEPKYILPLIDGLLSAVNFENETVMYEKIYERDRIQNEIIAQTKQMKQNVDMVYHSLEMLSCEDTKAQNAIKDAKLHGVYELGILKEVVEEGLLTTIEKGSDIQETSTNMIKDFVYRAIDSGAFTKSRFLNIVKSVLDTAIDIADSDSAHSKDVIRGSVFGCRDGISKAVEVFKNNLRFTPEDGDILSEYDLNEAKKELSSIDESFIELLKEYAKKDDTNSGKIIDEIVKKELDSTLAKMQRLTQDTRDVINVRIEDLRQNASTKFEQLKESAEEFEKIATQKVEEFKKSPKTKQAKEEAKKLGERAWEVAKEFAKNAKDAINKK